MKVLNRDPHSKGKQHSMVGKDFEVRLLDLNFVVTKHCCEALSKLLRFCKPHVSEL